MKNKIPLLAVALFCAAAFFLGALSNPLSNALRDQSYLARSRADLYWHAMQPGSGLEAQADRWFLFYVYWTGYADAQAADALFIENALNPPCPAPAMP